MAATPSQAAIPQPPAQWQPAYPVRADPIFYNRLKWALEEAGGSLDAEIEFLGRHLTLVETEFAQSWDNLPRLEDERRYVIGRFATIAAVFAVGARINHANEIVIWNI